MALSAAEWHHASLRPSLAQPPHSAAASAQQVATAPTRQTSLVAATEAKSAQSMLSSSMAASERKSCAGNARRPTKADRPAVSDRLKSALPRQTAPRPMSARHCTSASASGPKFWAGGATDGPETLFFITQLKKAAEPERDLSSRHRSSANNAQR